MEVESSNNKWVAGAGTTTLGIIGTALGGLNAVNGGLLGNLGGGGSNNTGTDNDAGKLRAEIAQLKAERYTDAAVIAAEKANIEAQKEFYAQFDAVRTKAAATDAKLDCLEQKLTTYEVTQREIAELKEKLVEAKFAAIDGKIDCLAEKVATGFAAANNHFAAIDAQIAGFTQTVIPQKVICDTGCGCNGCTQ